METLARQITALAERATRLAGGDMHKALAPWSARNTWSRWVTSRRGRPADATTPTSATPSAPWAGGRHDDRTGPLNRTTKQLIEDGRARQDALSKVDASSSR